MKTLEDEEVRVRVVRKEGEQTYKFGDKIRFFYEGLEPYSELRIVNPRAGLYSRVYIGGSGDLDFIIGPRWGQEEVWYGEYIIQTPSTEQTVQIEVVPDPTPKIHFATHNGIIYKEWKANAGLAFLNHDNYDIVLISPIRGEIILGKSATMFGHWDLTNIVLEEGEKGKVWGAVLQDNGVDVSKEAKVYCSGRGPCSIELDKESYVAGNTAQIHCKDAGEGYMLGLFPIMEDGEEGPLEKGYILTKEDQVFEFTFGDFQSGYYFDLRFSPFDDQSGVDRYIWGQCNYGNFLECWNNGCYWYDGKCHMEGRAPPTYCENRHWSWAPVPAGTSIGNLKDLCFGTLGCVVVKDGKRMWLSNKHVLVSDNGGAIGDPIFTSTNHEITASVADFVPTKQINEVDCAIAEPINDGLVFEGILYDYCDRKGYKDHIVPTGVMEPYIGQKVKKSGAKTGVTEGEVLALDFTCHTMSNTSIGLFLSDILCAKGDSGSLVLDAKTNKAVGLLSGGSTSRGLPIMTYVFPITKVLNALDVALFTGEVRKVVTLSSVPSEAEVTVNGKGYSAQKICMGLGYNSLSWGLKGYGTVTSSIRVTDNGIECLSVTGGKCNVIDAPSVVCDGFMITAYLKQLTAIGGSVLLSNSTIPNEMYLERTTRFVLAVLNTGAVKAGYQIALTFEGIDVENTEEFNSNISAEVDPNESVELLVNVTLSESAIPLELEEAMYNIYTRLTAYSVQ